MTSTLLERGGKVRRKTKDLVGATTSQGLIAAKLNQRASCAPPLLIGVTTSSGWGRAVNSQRDGDRDIAENKQSGINQLIN